MWREKEREDRGGRSEGRGVLAWSDLAIWQTCQPRQTAGRASCVVAMWMIRRCDRRILRSVRGILCSFLFRSGKDRRMRPWVWLHDSLGESRRSRLARSMHLYFGRSAAQERGCVGVIVDAKRRGSHASAVGNRSLRYTDFGYIVCICDIAVHVRYERTYARPRIDDNDEPSETGTEDITVVRNSRILRRRRCGGSDKTKLGSESGCSLPPGWQRPFGSSDTGKVQKSEENIDSPSDSPLYPTTTPIGHTLQRRDVLLRGRIVHSNLSMSCRRSHNEAWDRLLSLGLRTDATS